jgi:thioesterase domain-containing protein
VWVRGAAIRPVPSYAELPESALSEIEEQLSEDDDAARERLSRAFERFEQTQPALSSRVAEMLNEPLDETALALGYFLTLAIWAAFDECFGAALDEVTPVALRGVVESLELDEEIRAADPAEAVNSDDVVAMEQPHALSFVHEHVDAALEANANEVDVDDVYKVYRLVLIEVLALSYAVRAPQNISLPTVEFSA